MSNITENVHSCIRAYAHIRGVSVEAASRKLLPLCANVEGLDATATVEDRPVSLSDFEIYKKLILAYGV